MAIFQGSWLCIEVLFLFIQIRVFVANNKTIVVAPTGTTNLSSCGSAGNPCKTLDLALKTARDRGMNFTRILLKQGNYKLEETFVFSSAENVSLVGEADQVTIQCSSNVSLTFLLSQNIELQNLKFMECGGWQKSLVSSKSSSGEIKYMEYITGLYFSYVKNLYMSNVEVSGSNGIGLTLNDVSGDVVISKSTFINNSPRHRLVVKLNNQTSANNPEEHKRHTGGGIFVLLNSFGYNVINISRETHDTYQHNNRYFFTDLVFRGNEAESSGWHVTMNTPLVPLSRGGGIGIYLFGNASGNAFTLSRCDFEGNRAQWGGGLQVEFKHLSQGNNIRVEQSTFKENYASFAGGGARFGDLTISRQALKPNKFYFDNCQFINNTSIWGGGSSIYGTTFMGSIESPSNRDKFVLKNCQWRDNKGNVGSAIGVFLFNLNDDTIGPYQSVHVILENCRVANNNVITQEEDILIGQGAVYTVEVPIIFKGNISIANNTNTGMVLDSAMAVIDGQVEFRQNKGYSGGGLVLYGNSRIKFNKKSKLSFIGNECVEKGGAMYINAPGPPQVSFNATGYSTHQCFFDYEEQYIDYDKWDTEIVFQDNRAPNEESGLSVYATTLQNCRRLGEKRNNNTVLQWSIVTFLDASGKNKTSVNREVSTDPLNIAFERNHWIVGASEHFNASVALLDEKDNPVVGMVDISTSEEENSSSNVRLSTPSSLFLVNNKTIQHLSLSGKGGDRFSIALRSIGGRQLQKVITNLTLKECNPGFHNQGDKCVCSDTILPGISRCGDDGKTVYLKRGYWAGMFDGHFHTAVCPVNYCRFPNPFGSNLVGECTYIQNQMCSGNRDEDSVVCGRCKTGYTAAFGSDDCSKNCSVFKILYFIPIAFGLSLLVMLIMVINVDVFTGYLNAWLYSYQVITLITPGTYSFDGFMTFVIGLANLELRVGGTGICFTKGIDEADELMITYILPTYILVVVYFIGKAVRHWPNWRYSRKVKSPFSALCTLFVLCYTNITGISLKILNPVQIGDTLQLFVQGGLGFFQGKHIAYGIIAILFMLLVVAMVPFLLICQDCVTKYLRRIKINAQNLKPFFDKLQGCFKDEYRWCAAFYFLSRLLILVLDTYITRSPLKRAFFEGACVLILTVFVYLRPYKEGKAGETSYEWINLSDAVLLTNLTVISIFSSVFEESPSRSIRKSVGVFINILAYVPLIVLAAVLYKAFQQYSKNRKKEGHPLKMRFSQLLPRRRDDRESQFSDTTDNPMSDNPTNTAGYRTSAEY